MNTKSRRSERDEGYKLPNGCFLRPGGRVRIPREQVPQIPLADFDRLALVVEKGTASPGSVVIRRQR